MGTEHSREGLRCALESILIVPYNVKVHGCVNCKHGTRKSAIKGALKMKFSCFYQMRYNIYKATQQTTRFLACKTNIHTHINFLIHTRAH